MLKILKKSIAFAIFLLFILGCQLYSQTVKYQKELEIDDFKKIESQLLNKYGRNKIIPEKFKLPVLIALGEYPELKEVRIKFKIKRIATTMACRPSPLSLFIHRKKRKYIIFINEHSLYLQSVWAKNLSFNSQVGVFAHEIAHVIDYKNQNSISILGMAFGYQSKKYREKLEKSIDSIAIMRGFGWQIYEFANHVLNYSSVPDGYKRYKRNIYYTPKEILKKMIEFGLLKKEDYPD